MKYFIVALGLSAVLYSFASCKKEGINEQSFTPTAIIGSWELEALSGNMPTKTFPAGNGNIYQFTETAYKKFIDGSLTKSGNYAIADDSTVATSVGLNVPLGQFTHRIIFENDTTANKIFIDTQNGKLRLVSGYFPTDGGSLSVYAKKAN